MTKSITSVKNFQSGVIYTLPRGGYVVHTSQGMLQVVTPPETIKDSIFYINDVPSIYCIGDTLFDFSKGINIAELEFPIYYNFFIKNRKTIIIGNKEKCKIYEEIIKLILFGEGPLSLEGDYNPKSKLGIPDVKKEISFFLNYSFSDIVDFYIFDETQKCQIGKLQIENNKDEYIFHDQVDGKVCSYTIPTSFPYDSFYKDDSYPQKKDTFIPPEFGMTCLGASHGFDPLDNTSGFIFWANGSGIMVDPPVNSTDIFFQAGITPNRVDTLILTHIHADHDSGLFQKILEENRITIYSTETIMNLWLRKYSLLSSIPIDEIKKLFDFVPVIIDQPILIKGIKFDFRYMIHSIPTIGFTMDMRGLKITFSSDHLNEPTFFKKLYEHNFIGKKRYNELINFPWDSNLIYHEAGIPPLHTPVSFLDGLDENIKKKTFLYHISSADVPLNTSLTRCQPGVMNSVTYDIETNDKDKLERYSLILSKTYPLKKSGIDIKKSRSCLAVSNLYQEMILSPGDELPKDSDDDSLYLLVSGALAVHDSGKLVNNHRQIIPDHQLISNYVVSNHRGIVLKAIGRAELLKIDKESFLKFMDSPELSEQLQKSGILDPSAWMALEHFELFDILTLSQRANMVNMLRAISVGSDPFHIDPNSGLYIYHSGAVVAHRNSRKPKIGDVLGYIEKPLVLPQVYKPILEARVTQGLIYHISSEDFDFFILENPGLYYRFTYSNHHKK